MRILSLLLILVLVAGLPSAAFAEQVKRTAKIIELEGTVKVKPMGQEWQPAKVDMALGQGDVIVTKGASSAVLNLDGTGETATVTVTENSQLLLNELTRDTDNNAQATLLDLALGKVLIKAKKLHTEAERFEVKTPTTIVGVRGTVFEVEVGAAE